MKKVSVYWAFVIGALAPILQAARAYILFGKMVDGATFLDFVWFFIAGVVGGWIFVYFLNRQSSNAKRWIVAVAFLIASPIALISMFLGGLFGPLGVIIYPQIPWGGLTWFGSLVAGWVIRS